MTRIRRGHPRSAGESCGKRGVGMVKCAMLNAKESWFRAIVDTSLDAVLLITADGAISYGNPAVTRLWGYPLEELLGRKIFEFIHPEDLARVTDEFLALVGQIGSSSTIECRGRRRDGEWRLIG